MASQYINLPSLLGASTTGQILVNNGGIIDGLPGSTVISGTNFSAGSVSLAALALGPGATPLGLLGVYRLGVRGGIFGQNLAGTSTNFVCDPSTGTFTFGDTSYAFTGGLLAINSSYTLLTGGGSQVLLATDAGANVILSPGDGSVTLANSSYTNVMIVDGSGGVTVRATDDQGGLYADSSGYTYLGNYAALTPMIIDAAGNVAIATVGVPPSGTALLQVGPDPGTDGHWIFNGVNIGGQVFFDILSGSEFDSCSIRVFTQSQCGELAAIGNPGEYFTNSNSADVALKGDPAGGNRFLIGVGSGVSQLTIGSTGLSLSNLTSGRVTFAGSSGLLTDNAGMTYVSGSGFKLNTVGEGYYCKEGTNARMGVATLVAGAATVTTNKVTANSRIFLSHQTSGGTLGAVYVSTRTAATSFVITSTSATDTSTVAWFIVEPS